MNFLEKFEKYKTSKIDELVHDNWCCDITDDHQTVTFESLEFECSKKCNKHGFRINPNIECKSQNILPCFGCSNTFGVGLEWDETWVAQLNKILGDDWMCKNFGVRGASMDEISKIIYKYTLYKKPEIICCLFPEIYRLEFYDSHFNIFKNLQTHKTEDSELYKAYETIISYEYGLNNFIKNFKFIELICQKNNIKLFWYTWSEEILSLDLSKIKKYISLDGFLIDMLKYNIGDEKQFPLARDNSHIGAKYNKVLAESYFNRINKYKLKNEYS